MIPKLKFRIEFVGRDCWVGLYWRDRHQPALNVDTDTFDIVRVRSWYLCLVPCFPICWTTYSVHKI
jgi:hypothetical protein